MSRPGIRYDLLWPSTLTGKSGFEARVEEVLNLPLPSKTKAGVPPHQVRNKSNHHAAGRPARQSPQADLLLQFGKDLIRGQVRHDHDDGEDVVDHMTGDGCRLAVEVLTRQAKKGMMTDMTRTTARVNGPVSFLRCT